MGHGWCSLWETMLSIWDAKLQWGHCIFPEFAHKCRFWMNITFIRIHILFTNSHCCCNGLLTVTLKMEYYIVYVCWLNYKYTLHNWCIISIIAWHFWFCGITRRVPLVEQELLTLIGYLSSSTVFSGVHVVRSLDFCVMFCRPLFDLSVFCSLFWSLYCPSFFDLRLLIKHLVSSNCVAWCPVCPYLISRMQKLLYRNPWNCKPSNVNGCVAYWWTTSISQRNVLRL